VTVGRWFRDRPKLLEAAYRLTRQLFRTLKPFVERIGYARAHRWMRPVEKLSKGVLFDCTMCGQCVLHSTGMTCPMTCPKHIRNGPCGGVRLDGNCEIFPEMRCVWVEACERASKMRHYGDEMFLIQPPVNRQLAGASAWITMLEGSDAAVPEGWQGTSSRPTLPVVRSK
jgi:hypothetical protein